MRPPAKWKMFLITFPSAYILSSIIVPSFLFLLPGWPFLVLNALETVLLVFLLTYVALPLSTHLLRPWLEIRHETGHHALTNLQKYALNNSPGTEKSDDLRNPGRAVRKREYLNYPIYTGDPVGAARSNQRLQHATNHKKAVTSALTRYYPRV